MKTMERTQRWEVLNYIVSELQKKGQIGHTLLQKLVYLLQNAKGIPLGYDFHLHYYGPYSETLWGDINLLKNFGVLEVESEAATGGYRITSRKDPDPKKVKELEDKINTLVNFLGKKYVKQLELYATTYYVLDDLKKKNRPHSDSQVAKDVEALKPHINRNQILSALKELREKEIFIDG